MSADARIPDAVVESIDNYGLAEDRKTLLVQCTTADGRRLWTSFEPGQRPRMHLEPHPDAEPIADAPAPSAESRPSLPADVQAALADTSDLEKAVYALFEGFEALDTPVAGLHSWTRCEDGETWLGLVTLVDGRTAAITVRPGEPISVRIA